MKVEAVTEGAEYVVTVCVDEGYLRSAAYPVYVDPTFTIYTGTTGGTKNISDTTMYYGSPSSARGSDTTNTAGYNASYGVGRVLYKFTGLALNATYNSLTAAHILNAYFYTYASAVSGSGSVTAYYNNGGSWSEGSSYSSALYNGAGSSLDSNTFSSGSYGSFEITDAVIAWKNGSATLSDGIILEHGNESSDSVTFVATEGAGSTPYVLVNYCTTWTSVGSGGYPDVGQTVSSGGSYVVYLYAGDYTIESCRANYTSSYTMTVTVYDSSASVVDSDTSSSTASVSITVSTAGSYRVKVSAAGATCFARVKANSGFLTSTLLFADYTTNYRYKASEYTIDPECMDYHECNCATYAIPESDRHNIYAGLGLTAAEMDSYMQNLGNGGYSYSSSQQSTCVVVYFNSAGESTHFARIDSGIISARMGVEGPIVYHSSVYSYYSQYGNTVRYYVKN